MRTLNINIPILEEILFVLKKDEKSLLEEARKILALQFLKERKLSLVIEISRVSMTLFLSESCECYYFAIDFFTL